MPTITIDGKPVTVDDGATILQAARAAGVHIPTLCHRDGLPPSTSCLVCVVQVDGAERMLPACATAARDGMAVASETEEVHAARRMALELLLGDHLGDCLGPCQVACPAGMNIPLMLRQIAAGAVHDAAGVARTSLVLPATLGRICPAPCEKVCRRAPLDEALAIRTLHRHAADSDLAADSYELPERAPATGKRVAIVGAGPAGLATAWHLLILGHEVTLYDDHDQAGGMLRHPELAASLHADILDEEISLVTRLGARMVLGERVGVADLRAENDALIVACGEVDGAAAEALGLPMGSRGLAADRATGATDQPGVFVCGAALSPGRMAVRAVASGTRAATSADAFMRGDAPPASGREFNVSMGRQPEDELRAFAEGAATGPRVVAAGGAHAGYTDAEAAAEAARCLHCDCRALDDCRLRRYAMEYGASPTHHKCGQRKFERDASHPLVIYESGKCIDCGLCIEIASGAAEELGLTFVGRGFNVRMAVPLGEALSDGLRQVARECAEACPTGALVLREDAPGA